MWIFYSFSSFFVSIYLQFSRHIFFLMLFIFFFCKQVLMRKNTDCKKTNSSNTNIISQHLSTRVNTLDDPSHSVHDKHQYYIIYTQFNYHLWRIKVANGGCSMDDSPFRETFELGIFISTAEKSILNLVKLESSVAEYCKLWKI